MSVSISFTSLSIEQDIQTSEQLLTKTNCLHALYAMHSVRWFRVRKKKIFFFEKFFFNI